MTPARGACRCHACIVAGCTRPPVNLAGRWLHGRALQRYYADVDRRRALCQRLREDYARRRGDR